MDDAKKKKIIERYWLNRLSGNSPKITLPQFSMEGDSDKIEKAQVEMPIPAAISGQLHEICNRSDIALFILFFTGLAVVLNKYTGLEDLLIGTVSPKKEMVKSKLIFCRTRIQGDLTLKETVNQVKQRVLEDFNYTDDYSFGELYQKLSTLNDSDYLDIFNIAFVYDRLQKKGKLKFLNQFHLAIFLSDGENENQLQLQAAYNANIYSGAMIRRFCENLIHFFDNLAGKLDQPLADIGILSPSQYRELWDFNQTAVPYPKDATIHGLFAEQVEKTPDNTAVIFEDQHLSYRQLNEKADRLAAFLKDRGVRKNSIVGLMLDRSPEIVIGQLGILKAGGAFLPIDPGTPTRRIASMLEDCSSSFLLTASPVGIEELGGVNHSFTVLQGLQTVKCSPHITPTRQRIADFNALPFPNRSLIDYEKYNRYLGQAVVKNRILIQAARGCPYNCSYCYRIWSRKQVARSGENLFNEVRLYYRMGIRKFDIFMMNLKQGRTFFELIIRHNMEDIQLYFPNGFRGDLLTKEYVDLMVKAGTVNFALALETASPRLQKLINKNLNLDKFREIVDYICKTYPQVILELFTMHGIPTETEEEARMTLDFIKSFKWIHFPYVNVLKIYHNTGMEELALQSGLTREQILRSENLAWHELSDTLPFERSFSAGYQTEFLNNYLLSKERLLHVLPYQMKILTEDEIVEKYDSYLPTDINGFGDLLAAAGITADELEAGGFCDETADITALTGFNEKLAQHFSAPEISRQTLRILLLDLSQFFSDSSDMLYDVVDIPLGLMYILTYLNREMGDRIKGKILKPRMDFDSFEELKSIVEEFQPHVIGVRSLTFYKDFLHETAGALRQWGFAGPIIAGGPYATVDYETLLQDRNIDVVVLSEGEETFCELIEKIIENQGKLPGEHVLREIPGIAFIPAKEAGSRFYGREIIMMDRLQGASSQTPLPKVQSSDPAYAIFTSGSTGTPKGVLIEHRSAVNVLKWFARTYQVQPGTHVIQVTNYTFDPSVEQIYSPLIHGAAVFIPTKADISNREVFAEFVHRKQINMINSVPILLKELLGYRGKLNCLDIVISGGEKLENIVKNQILKKGYRLYNQYGPTETTIDALMTPCSAENVTLGRPISNVNCCILDKSDLPVPIGVAGELLIGGAGVSRGYLNRPELTAERFVRVKDRLYRTGDLARWLESGAVEFLGRIDHQVKIRGFRIELGEIENHLQKHAHIKDAVVITCEVNEENAAANPGEPGDKFLAAYIVPEPGLSLSIPGIREYLAARLPDYMIPAHVVFLESLPLNPNGKIDRKALPDPINDSYGSHSDYVPPGNPIEKKLAEIWEGVLGRKPIGVNDNFFIIGGDSIKSIQIASRMNMEGYKLEMRDIFEYPTISQLGPRVRELERPSDQSAVEGTVPLLPSQVEFFEKYKTAPHHFNQSVMLYSQEGFSEEAVRAVFTRIQEHHDALRITFKKEEGGKVLQINHGPDYPLALQEFDLCRLDSGQEALTALANKADEIQSGIDLEQGPLMKLGLFHLHDGDRLLIVIHHLLVDGISWRILFEDIETLHRQYREKKELELPLKTDSLKTWSEKLREYADTPAFLAEKDYWAEMESRSIPELKKDFEVGENLSEDTAALSFQLNAEETTQLLIRVNHAFGTEINDILLTALLLAVQEAYGYDRLLIALEGHGREEILDNVDVTRTIGWFTSVYPVLLEFSPKTMQLDDADEGKTARQVKEIKEILHQLPHRGIGYGILKYLTAEKHKTGIPFKLKPQVSFNYLGQFDRDLEEKSFAMARESAGTTISEKSDREYDFDISGIIANKQLTVSIAYNRTHYRTAGIETILRLYKERLLHIIFYCSSREHTEATPSDFTYRRLSLDALEAAAAYLPSPIEDIYTLAPMQEGMLFHALVDPSSSAYFEQISYRVQGLLDIDVVRKSLDELCKRYDILRTVFIYEGLVQPVQVVLKERTVEFIYKDLTEMEEQKDGFIREFKEKDRRRTFDLSKDSLMRVAVIRVNPTEYEFLWSHHHILMDGWCTGVLVAEFMAFYQALAVNRPAQLPPVTPYRTYIRWIEKQDKQASADFWQRYLEHYHTAASIALIGELKTGKTRKEQYQNQHTMFQLDGKSTEILNRLAADNQVTQYTVFQVIWGILLSKYHNNVRDVVFGSVVSGRSPEIPGVESMVGLFINTIPVRISYNPKTTVKELLKKIREDALNCEPYHYYPLARIQADSSLKQHLLDHILLYENFPVTSEISAAATKSRETGKGGGVRFSNIEAFEQTNYDFNVIIAPADGLIVRFEYNGNRFDTDRVVRTAGHLKRLLHQVLDSIDREVDHLSLLSPEEKKKVVEEFNKKEDAAPVVDKTLHRLFEDQAAKTPENTALICREHRLTYSRLNDMAGQLAHRLIDRGVRSGTVVPLIAEPSLHMARGILGILKAGAAYLPIDANYPEERIKYMLGDSGAKVLLTAPGTPVKIENEDKEQAIEVLDVSGLLSSSTATCRVSPTNLAYIIYTSGTTGRPRGVAVKHRGVVNYTLWRHKTYGYTEKDITLQLLSFAFDGFVSNFYSALLSGGTLVTVPGSHRLDFDYIRETIRSHRVTNTSIVPGIYEALLDQAGPGDLDSLRFVVLGGERASTNMVKRSKEIHPNIKLINEYGPAETTVTAVAHTGIHMDNPGIIGKPIANTGVYILDNLLEPVPVGIPGELCVCGTGAARGYINRPQLTREKFYFPKSLLFLPSPLYRTGDLARWLPDGTIEFLGRIDTQVKIRGFRIEPGEIQRRLLTHHQVKEAVVVVQEDGRENKFLCAYIVPENPADPDSSASLSVSRLRSYLLKYLSDFMVPSHFVQVEKIPLTPNGKVDAGALSAMGTLLGTGVEYAAPINEMQKITAAIWKDILKLDNVGINDNFFDLGGNSMDIIQVNNRLKQVLERDIPIVTLFEYPTIAGLVEYLEQEENGGIEEQEIEQFDTMQDEAVSMMEHTLQILDEDDNDSE